MNMDQINTLRHDQGRETKRGAQVAAVTGVKIMDRNACLMAAPGDDLAGQAGISDRDAALTQRGGHPNGMTLDAAVIF